MYVYMYIYTFNHTRNPNQDFLGYGFVVQAPNSTSSRMAFPTRVMGELLYVYIYPTLAWTCEKGHPFLFAASTEPLTSTKPRLQMFCTSEDTKICQELTEVEAALAALGAQDRDKRLFPGSLELNFVFLAAAGYTSSVRVRGRGRGRRSRRSSNSQESAEVVTFAMCRLWPWPSIRPRTEPRREWLRHLKRPTTIKILNRPCLTWPRMVFGRGSRPRACPQQRCVLSWRRPCQCLIRELPTAVKSLLFVLSHFPCRGTDLYPNASPTSCSLAILR